MSKEHCWHDFEQGKGEVPRESCPNATVSTINPIRTGLGLNSGLRGERPTINHLAIVWSDCLQWRNQYQTTTLWPSGKVWTIWETQCTWFWHTSSHGMLV